MSDMARSALAPKVWVLTAGAPLAVRAHCAVRAVTCPLDRVVAAAADAERVLEVGCGHGLLSSLLALARPGRRVVGIDIDGAKVAGAAALVANVIAQGASLEVHATDGASLPTGGWDAIVLADVIYLLDAAAQEAMVQDCAAALVPGGRLIVKEMGTVPRWKVHWNRLQETLAVRVLRVTEGSTINPPPPDAVRSWMEASGLTHRGVPIDAGYVHPHFLHVGTAP